jgi:hypothetical protein
MKTLSDTSKQHLRALCTALLKRNAALGDALSHLARHGGVPDLEPLITADISGTRPAGVAAVEALLADVEAEGSDEQ